MVVQELLPSFSPCQVTDLHELSVQENGVRIRITAIEH